jgi:hypothetical protein
MRDPRRRLERLEYAHLRRLAANAGKPSSVRTTFWTKRGAYWRCPTTNNARYFIASMRN